MTRAFESGATPISLSEREPARARVLILDESPTILRQLQEILVKLRVREGEIVQATTPDDALAYFAGQPPELVFAEFIGTHNEDGLEIIHEMLDRSPHTRVVLCTAETRDCPEVKAALRAGIFAYVEKPLRYEKIRQVLADLDDEKRGVERLR